VPETIPPVLDVEDLSVTYATAAGLHTAVSSVSLRLRPGEFVGLAGESGCGKSTLALALSRILPPAAEVSAGTIRFHPADSGGQPVDVLGLSGRQLRAFRWRRLSMVFQGAMNSLNPVMTIGHQLADAIRAHQRVRRAECLARCGELLDLVGVGAAHLNSYPHQLSGGMRQRVMLAMALSLDPDVVVMDEPTTALDVVVQRELLEVIRQLQRRLGFAVLFITHDLALLLDLADRVSIMYGGQIVEEAPAEALIGQPAHPYTAGLLGSFPELEGPPRELRGIPGSPPDFRDLPAGCLFAPRCPHVRPACLERRPTLGEAGGTRRAACFYPLGGAKPLESAKQSHEEFSSE
jgi:peptide/nickel transport system ATP-binding protein